MTGQANQILNWENELAVRARQQAVVAELGQRALEGAELDELLNETAQQVAQTLEVEYCEVLELLPEEDSLLLRAGFGWTPGLVGKARIDADLESQAGYTLFTRQPVIVEDLKNETRFKGNDLLLKHWVVSGLSVIIQGPGRPFGVLGAFTRSTRVFTTDDIHFFKSIANILAAAIQRKGSEVELQTLNANLEQRVIERTGYLRMLHMVGIAANQAVSAEPVLRFVLEKVCAFTGWPVGHVYFQRAKPDSNGEQELVSSDLWHLQDKQRFAALVEATAKTRLAPGEDLPGEVIRRGEAVWIIDVSEDKNFVRNRTNLELGVKSGFAFPVLVGSETAAVMEFFSDETAEPTHGMLDVMEQVGAMVGRVVERERAQQELQRREAQLSDAQQIAHLGSWEWDLISNQIEWSDEMYRIYGLELGETIESYEGFLERVHPDDREMVIQAIDEAYQKKNPFEIIHRILRPDGSERTIFGQGKPVINQEGELVKMVGTGLDITQRRQTEEALQESLNLLEGLFESSPDGTVLITEGGLIVRLNREMENLFGYGRDELLGKPLETLLPERFRELHIANRTTYTTNARTRPMGAGVELFGRRKDGSEFPVDITLSPLTTSQGLLVICVVRDITDRIKVAEALRNSEARFRAIFEGAAIGMAVIDLEQRIVFSNPRLGEILGYSREELSGKVEADLSHPAERGLSRRLYEDLVSLNRDHYQLDKRYLRKDGQMIWCNHTVSVVRAEDGRPEFAISMLEDITPRKQMEAELAEVQRRLLASREAERVHLAQEIHDVPLQDLYAVLYQINEFDDAALEDQTLQKNQSEIRYNLQQVINTLRTICGELRPPTLSPFGLEGAIREYAENFRAKYPELNVWLKLAKDGQALSEDVRLNLFRIYQQALNNVARHSGAKNVNIRLNLKDEEVVLEIEDDGSGFEVPHRWIRLAREGHLGLVGSVERAEMISGHFEVVSALGKGTLVRVIAPQSRESISNNHVGTRE